MGSLKLGQLYFEISADNSKLKRGMTEAKTESAAFGSSMKRSLASTVAMAGTGLLAAVSVGKLARAFGDAAKLSLELGETQSKFNTVFGSSSDKVDELANSFGILTKGEAKALLATTGSILSGAGFAGEALQDMATKVGTLARDFASFNNLPIEDTFNAINSALTGEREQLKRLGIVIQETDVQQAALNETGKESAKLLTQQEKAAATLGLIMKKGGVQVGDWARTQDSAANQSKQLETAIRNLWEEVAEKMAPAIGNLVTKLNEFANSPTAKKFAEDLATAFSEMAEILADLAINGVKAIQDIDAGLTKWGLNTSISEWVDQTMKDLRQILRVVDRVADSFNTFLGAGRNPLPASNLEQTLLGNEIIGGKNGAPFDPQLRQITNPVVIGTGSKTPASIRFPNLTDDGGGGGGGGGAVKRERTTLEIIREQVEARIKQQQVELALLSIANRRQAYYDVSENNMRQILGLSDYQYETIVRTLEPLELQGDKMGMVRDAIKETLASTEQFVQTIPEINKNLDGIGVAAATFASAFNKEFNAVEGLTNSIADGVLVWIDLFGKVENKAEAIREILRNVANDLARAIIVAGVKTGINVLTNGIFGAASNAIPQGTPGDIIGGIAKGAPLKLRVDASGEALYTVLENYKGSRGLA